MTWSRIVDMINVLGQSVEGTVAIITMVLTFILPIIGTVLMVKFLKRLLKKMAISPVKPFSETNKDIIDFKNNLTATFSDSYNFDELDMSKDEKEEPKKIHSKLCSHCGGIKTFGQPCPYCGLSK